MNEKLVKSPDNNAYKPLDIIRNKLSQLWTYNKNT